MKFFSGFSLKDEEYLFSEYIKKSDYSVCGFSYGATKALAYTLDEIEKGNRIDTLQLLSPSFFENKKGKFKRLQLMSYKKNKTSYIKQFLQGCFLPYEEKIVQIVETSIDELENLLHYKWSLESLEYLVSKGVKIEVYLGGRDKIVDANASKDFFLEVSTVTYIKDANHFLQLN